MSPANAGGIRRVVEVPVREKEPVDVLAGKMLICALRSVKKKIPARGLQEISVGIEWTASEHLKLFHVECVEII